MKRKDLNDFKQKVNTTMMNTLKKYRPEIEIALGPAKVTIRPVPVNVQNLNQEQDIDFGEH